ncbi:MAG: PQQ-binding-like beta-propeller repeat protein, partial [Planctomycetota bacterium]
MTRKRLFLAAACWLAGWTASGADWPMWRCDPNRSAASPEELPDQLDALWVREFPPVRPAWPNEPRLHFDASYEPVVLGKLLFAGSPNDGSVTAYSTETSELRWKFFSDGPVRFAPVAWKDRLCFGSDDGCVYCLNSADGTVKWKTRLVPEDRPERKHLGNARLISFWPVRGGPVLADGTIYAAAGLWPTLGVFIAALDVESGRVVWLNRDANLIKKVRVDHNELQDSGLSPQGYLVLAGETLLVPNGRSMPACLDRKTGQLLHYLQGYRNGDCRVTAMGQYAFVGREGVVDIATGREAGSRWAQAGSAAPKNFVLSKMDLFESPAYAYNKRPACSAWSALGAGTVYGLHQGVFYAYDLSHPAVAEYDTQYEGHKLKPWRWELPELWKFATPYAKDRPACLTLIKAGNRLYSHAGQRLLAAGLPTAGGEPKVLWERQIEGTPSALLAADGKLFAMTKEGRLYCFAAGRAGGTPALPGRAGGTPALPGQKPADGWEKTAGEILKCTQVSDGYCLVLGIGSGRLFEELLAQSSLRLIGVDSDAEKVRRLRERLGVGPERFQVICATASFSEEGQRTAGNFGAQLAGVPPETFAPVTGRLAARAPSAPGSAPDAAALA